MEDISIQQLLKRIDIQIKSKFDQAVAKYDLTRSQCFVLGYIIKNKDKQIHLKDIEKALNLQKSTVSGILDRLEKNGFLERVEVEGDARCKALDLTAKAFELEASIKKDSEKIAERMLDGLNQNEQDQLKSLLNRLYKNIKDEEVDV